MKKKLLILLLALAAASIFAQGKFTWIDPVSDDKDTILPGVDPSKVRGSIITAGSSTVFPLSEAIAERFKKEGFTGQVTVDSIGTGAGFERWAKAGETDIANASRAIKASEKEWAAKLAKPRTPIEFRIGTDALAVVVSVKNTFAADITIDELGPLFSTATYWSDVRASWPKKEIKRFSPGTDSGTFDYFVEQALKSKKELLLTAKNLQLSEDDNILVQGVAGDEYAVGYFGFAYYIENKGKLRDLAVNKIAPSKETVDKGSYPLSRPLFLYSDATIINEKPQVAAFLAYYLTYVNDLIGKVGYFPAPAEALRVSKSALAATIKGRF
ncbi:MAG: PstS family phosphate ABC transporter substrate-binding protein [Spirochaetes bacterium]|nr:PstS family phosphate ABC transporter substrate-binding protein [Spirochaetota bacterium]